MSTIDLLSLDHYTSKVDHQLFRELRDNDPVHLNPTPEGDYFHALTRYDHVTEIGRDNRRFINSKGTQIRDKRAEGHGAPSVHNADQPLHARLRAPGVEAFRKSVLKRREDRIRQVVRDLINAAPQNQPFDFVSAIAVTLPMIIFAELLGVPESQQHLLVEWANTMSDVNAADIAQADARHHLFAYFRELSEEKRRHLHAPCRDLHARLSDQHPAGPRARASEDDPFHSSQWQHFAARGAELRRAAGSQHQRVDALQAGGWPMTGHPGAIAQVTPERAAIIAEDGSRLSYNMLDRRSLALAQQLHTHGVRPGDAIALLIGNRPDFFIAAWAAQRSGLYYTPIATKLTPTELGYIFEDSGVRAVILDPALRASAVTALAPMGNNRPLVLSLDPGTEFPVVATEVDPELPYRDTDEAISIANESPFGLSGSVWTPNIDRALEIARQLRTGTVGLNSKRILDFAAPFGGHRASGIGRELGPEGIDGYLETTSILLP